VENFNQELLTSLVGQSLQVCAVNDPTELTQLKVSDVTEGKVKTTEFSSFCIELIGDPQVQLPQGTYVVKHHKFGEQTLFMTIHAEDQYQIVISHKNAVSNQ
jgi:hypothetical protein